MLDLKEKTEFASSVMRSDLRATVEEISLSVIGRRPSRVAIPGGKSRSVFVVEVDGTSYVFAKRENKYDAKVEAKVLKILSPTGLVPEYVGKRGDWIVQAFISGTRLPVLLDQADNAQDVTRLAKLGLDSLLEIQKAADKARLRKHAPRLGVVEGWAKARVGAINSISEAISIVPPEINQAEMVRVFSSNQRDFIKWDARAGNAIIDGDNICWFDWEDCGLRNRIDDLVCFLADEWMPLDEPSETELINEYLPKFGRGLDADWADRYFWIAGCLQILFRLRLAVDYYQRDGEWWDRDYCLRSDKVGVTPQEIGRLLNRLSRWSSRDSVLLPLADWSNAIAQKLSL